MNKPESEKTLDLSLKRCVEQQLKGWHIKLSSLHITGLPDRICLLPRGRLFFAEIKTTGQKPRKIQLWVHTKLRNLGFSVWVVDSTEIINQIREDYK